MVSVPSSKRHVRPGERPIPLIQAGDSLPQMLGRLLQASLGVVLILLGAVLVSTLLLMPVGIPLALLGAALLATADGSGRPGRT